MVGIKSDVGNIRNLNEDYALYDENEKYKIYIVADGMGGHNAGEVASKMACEKVMDFIKGNFGVINEEELLRKAVEYANAEVYNFAHTDGCYYGMGTTIVSCLITNNIIYIANVGDSSCFGIKENKVSKLTKDHSLVQELLDFGTITEEEAKNHNRKNVITRAIGTKDNVEIDIFNINKGEYDLFMLCSDGLSNEISSNDIVVILNNTKGLGSASNELVRLAKMRGGRDNITVVLFGGEV